MRLNRSSGVTVDGAMPTRLITFAGSTVAVEFEGDRPAGIVEFLFRDVPAGPPQFTSSRLSEPPLSLILFPRYQPGGDFALTGLSKAQTGLELMQCLINARNLPEHGFPEISRLSKHTPAYKINYSSFDQIGDRIEALFDPLS